MKKIILFTILVFLCTSLVDLIAQGEKIDWSNLKIYSTPAFEFKTDQLTIICKECQYAALKSTSGVSGYFLLGKANVSIVEKKVNENSTGGLLRLNPKDSIQYLIFSNPKEITDKGFSSLSNLVLNDIFKRSYHAGMNALIPDSGDYTLTAFCEKSGDLFVSIDNGKMVYFNSTEK